MTPADFTVVDELPPKRESTEARDAKTLFRFLVANPDRWVEAYRAPSHRRGGTTNNAPYQKAKRLRDYGVEVEVRRDGDDRVVYARLVPGNTDGAA